MRCSACGGELHKGAEICRRCGTPVALKKSGASLKRGEKTGSAAKVKYRVSKLKIFLVFVVIAAIAVLGCFVVKANRKLEGTWLYVGDTDFFTGEKIDEESQAKKAQKTLMIQQEAVITIDNNTFSLNEPSKGINESSEYTFSNSSIKNDDNTLALNVKWSGFSPQFSGNLFGTEGVYKNFKRVSMPEDTIQNIVFIVIFSMMMIFLMFVLSIEDKQVTVGVGALPGVRGGATGRTMLVRRAASKTATAASSSEGMLKSMFTRAGSLDGNDGDKSFSYSKSEKMHSGIDVYATTVNKSVGLRSTLYTKSGDLGSGRQGFVSVSDSKRFSVGSDLDGNFEKPSDFVGKSSYMRSTSSPGEKEVRGLKISSPGNKSSTASGLEDGRKSDPRAFELSSHSASEPKKASGDEGSSKWFGSAGDL